MKRFASGLLVAILVAGCTSIPFQETSFVSMESVDPQAVLKSFSDRSLERFQLLNTIVFQYRFNQFMALGYIDINTNEKSFMVTSINPMGVKLFELSGDKDGVVSHFVMPELAKRGDVAAFVGMDIKRIYFDLIPSPEAKIEKKKFKIIFRQSFGLGIMEYVFAGVNGNLIEKKYYENDTLIWRVSYYEYLQDKGKLYPKGIVFKSYKYGYSLIVKLKEIRG